MYPPLPQKSVCMSMTTRAVFDGASAPSKGHGYGLAATCFTGCPPAESWGRGPRTPVGPTLQGDRFPEVFVIRAANRGLGRGPSPRSNPVTLVLLLRFLGLERLPARDERPGVGLCRGQPRLQRRHVATALRVER